MRFLREKLNKAQEAHEELLKSFGFHEISIIIPVTSDFSSEPKLEFVEPKIEFVKPKIEFVQPKIEIFEPKLELSTDASEHSEDIKKLQKRRKRQSPTKTSSPMKNIVSNFGRAISHFATSYIAIPYLLPQLQKEGVTLDEFVRFVNGAKNDIGSIQGMRRLLILDQKDHHTVIVYKKIFKNISEVFIKYFSVNWITHGKITHKLVYLKFRYNMLRRIQNPQQFTYMKKSLGRK